MPGFADCDMNPGNGCETNLASPLNCGVCFNRCPNVANANSTCSMARCGFTCRPGFDDCDANAVNGCEVSLNAPTSCGSCTNVCSMSDSCSTGMCVACPMTQQLVLNTTVMGTLPVGNMGVLAPPTCSAGSTGIEDVYRLDITTPSVVTIETQNSTLDTVLFVRAACGSTSDLACNDDIPGGGQLSRLTVALQPGTYFVIVEQWRANSNAPRQYSLSATAVTNTTCGSATVLTPGVQLNGNSVNGATPSNACTAAAGGELFYQLDLPPNTRGEVRVTPAGTASLTTRLRNSCSATTCVAASQGVTPQVVTFDNTTGATQSVVVSVAATGFNQNSAFTIAASLTMLPPRPYLITPIVAACDDLSMQPDVLGSTTAPALADDVTTAALPLPFAFSYWATPVTHYSVASNGFAQLHTSAAGLTSSAFQNLALPNAMLPNGVAAVMWADLRPASMTSGIRVLTSGTAPARVFTIAWNDFAFLQGGMELMTFQLKLFETTQAVEFHYCSMQANGGGLDRLTGGTSTIGLENLSGDDAVQQSHRTPNSVFDGRGLRFTPP
jgi:hypothetical protein